MGFFEGYYFFQQKNHYQRIILKELDVAIQQLKHYVLSISKEQEIPKEHCYSANKLVQKLLDGFPPQQWEILEKIRLQRGKNIQDLKEKFPADIEWILQELRYERDRLKRQKIERFPDQEQWVLPTRFGNAIRAFEVYPRVMYGLDDIPGWDRLIAVIPKDYLNLVDSAKAQVDFWINFCFLGVICMIEYIVSLLYTGTLQLQVFPLMFPFMTLLLSVWAYLMAIESVGDWGELVKSAYDLFLPELRKKLNFSQPSEINEENFLWTKFSQAIIYRNPQKIAGLKNSSDDSVNM